MSLASIRSALADAIALAIGDEFNVYGYESANPTWPAVIVSFPDNYEPNSALRGEVEYQLPVRVEIPVTDDESADALLCDVIEPTGTRSLLAVLDADPTLGGTVDSAAPMDVTQFGYRDVGEIRLLTATVMVSIYP